MMGQIEPWHRLFLSRHRNGQPSRRTRPGPTFARPQRRSAKNAVRISAASASAIKAAMREVNVRVPDEMDEVKAIPRPQNRCTEKLRLLFRLLLPTILSSSLFKRSFVGSNLFARSNYDLLIINDLTKEADNKIQIGLRIVWFFRIF